jgi:hypothetical protein
MIAWSEARWRSPFPTFVEVDGVAEGGCSWHLVVVLKRALVMPYGPQLILVGLAWPKGSMAGAVEQHVRVAMGRVESQMLVVAGSR